MFNPIEATAVIRYEVQDNSQSSDFRDAPFWVHFRPTEPTLYHGGSLALWTLFATQAAAPNSLALLWLCNTAGTSALLDNTPPHEHTTEADATDEEQSSDDEAPEEVSAAAATALAGRRRKAEHQARQAAGPAPKRKRARTSSSSAKGATGISSSAAAAADAEGEGDIANGLELPSDLLLKVKSGGQQRMEADDLEAREMEEEAALEAALAGKRGARMKAGDVPRRWVGSPRRFFLYLPCAAVGALSLLWMLPLRLPPNTSPG